MPNSVHQYYFSKDSPENVVQVIRQHLIILVANLSFGVALLVIGFIGLDVLHHVTVPSFVPHGVVFGIEALYFVVALLLLYLGWFIYTRTEVIITEKHLVDVTQKTFFSRDVSQLEIARVQDVTDKRNGVLQTIFNYGEVIIQTAGEEDFFKLENLPHPDKTAAEFVELFPKWPKEMHELDQKGGPAAGQTSQTSPTAPAATAQTDSTSPKPAEPEPEAEDYLAD
jgi:uncharacterized membrane protein YdbT with pleckstrin-like domain